jgi:hypothetical protein
LAAEKEYLLEYYSLIREGKTAYCSFLAFMQVFEDKPQEIPDFFKAYAVRHPSASAFRSAELTGSRPSSSPSGGRSNRSDV